MNECIVWTIIGFIAGGLVGILVADKFIRKSYEDQISKLRADNDTLSAERTDAILKREKAVDLALNRQGFDADSIKKDRPTMVRLARQYGNSSTDVDPDDMFQKEILETAGPQDDTPIREPFVIDAEVWQNDYPNSENVSLSFYQDDHILAYDTDEAVRRPFDLIGEHGMEVLRDTKEDVIYIHCDARATNYEILVLHEQNYKEVVLGESGMAEPIEDSGFDYDEEEEDDDDE